MSAENRAHIEEVAHLLGYRPNDQAVALASSRSGVIGVVLPDIRNPFLDAVLGGMHAAAAEAEHTLMFTLSGQEETTARAQAERFLRSRVAGLIMVTPRLPAEDLRRLGDLVPLCLAGRAPVGGKVSTVRVDEEVAAELVVEALVARGFTAAIQITPRLDRLDPTGVQRASALARTAARKGLGWTHVEESDDEPVIGALLRETALPVALVAHNDMLALDVIAAVAASGLRLGSDVVLVSYDNTYVAARAEFSLSSIDQSSEVLGRTAVNLVLDESREPGRDVLIRPELVVRSSLGPATA